MNRNILEAIVVGAGHAGLSASYYLKRLEIDHVIFERGKIGESWRSQRWDSFALNTSNRLSLLPEDTYTGDQPECFASAKEFAYSLEAYASKFKLPVKEHVTVINISKPAGRENFVVTVAENNIIKTYQSRQVIICSGNQNTKKIPAFTNRISTDIEQLHASEYRNASALPDGAVLVVGSAQSGCQITEDLLDAGKKVYLSTCAVARIPRRYRGKDIMDWLIKIGFFDMKTADVTDPKVFYMPAPQVSGTGKYGHTVSLQQLACRGTVILGRLKSADPENAFFMLNAREHVQFADEFSKKVKDMVDEFISKNQLVLPAPEEDLADIPNPEAAWVSNTSSINFKENNISSIIWTTGFGKDFSYVDLPVFDKEGNPQHDEGVSVVEGLYFLGLSWLRMRKSGVIYGIKEDAQYIGNKVYQYSKKLQNVKV